MYASYAGTAAGKQSWAPLGVGAGLQLLTISISDRHIVSS